MVPNSTVASAVGESETEVMASIDDAGTDREYVIADVTTDDAWLSVTLSDAKSLDSWR